MAIKLVAIDHDGVVVDSSEDVYLAAWELMADRSLGRRRIPSFLDFLRGFRLPGDEWFTKHGFDFSADEIAKTLRRGPGKALMFPTVPPLLVRIQEELKLPIVMVSAGDQSRIEKQLNLGRVLHHFELVVGGVLDKAMAITLFCSAFDIAPAEAVYIGDRPSDMEHGCEAGVLTIGFTDGRPVMEKVLTEAGARFCARNHEELGNLLAELSRS